MLITSKPNLIFLYGKRAYLIYLLLHKILRTFLYYCGRSKQSKTLISKNKPSKNRSFFLCNNKFWVIFYRFSIKTVVGTRNLCSAHGYTIFSNFPALFLELGFPRRYPTNAVVHIYYVYIQGSAKKFSRRHFTMFPTTSSQSKAEKTIEIQIIL